MSNMTASAVEALPWTEVESSNVRRVAWVENGGAQSADGESTVTMGQLYVEFRGSAGRVYSYAGVREEQHAELLEADSIGGYLNGEIKPAHECERIDVVADAPPGPPTPPKPAAHRPVG